MKVVIDCGGVAATWALPDAEKFEEWIRGNGWITNGGVHYLKLPGQRFFSRFAESARQMIVGRLSARHQVSIDLFSLSTAADANSGLEQHILNRLGTNQNSSAYDRLLEASQAFEATPHAFLIGAKDDETSSIYDQAIDFADRIDKVGCRRIPLLLIFASHDPGILKPYCDLTRGYPEELRLCDPEKDDKTVWNRYIHQRIAWEAGGGLFNAEEWEKKFQFSKLPFNQDDSLEQRLNSAATEEFNSLDVETRRTLREFFDEKFDVGSEASKFDWGAYNRLKEFGLISVLPGLHAWMVKPWVARALIQMGASGSARVFLGGCLTCMPIANELLSQCFALEVRERTNCNRCLQNEDLASNDAKELFARYRRGEDNSEASFYPADCPVAPNSVWQFASFGEIIRLAKNNTEQKRYDARHLLRRVRNAISHGHYVSWSLVSAVRSLLNSLI